MREVALGELESLKALPGMAGAVADTLHKVWRADFDLKARAGEHPRLASIATLEEAVLAALPPAMMRPSDLVKVALQRLDHVGALFGSIEVVGITELSPCWGPLLHAIAKRTPVRWIAGPRSVPGWLDASVVEVLSAEHEKPEISTVSAANAYYEATEPMRWARGLIASGKLHAPLQHHRLRLRGILFHPIDDLSRHVGCLSDHRRARALRQHVLDGVQLVASEGGASRQLARIVSRSVSRERMRPIVMGDRLRWATSRRSEIVPLTAGRTKIKANAGAARIERPSDEWQRHADGRHVVIARRRRERRESRLPELEVLQRSGAFVAEEPLLDKDDVEKRDNQ